jgi:hypothetical protein
MKCMGSAEAYPGIIDCGDDALVIQLSESRARDVSIGEKS